MNIVIIGGGFAGLAAVRPIVDARITQVCVTLIDARDHFLFAPRLIDLIEYPKRAAEASLPFSDIAERLGFRFVQGTVRSIERGTRHVAYSDAHGNTQRLAYDLLVVCPGSSVNFYGIPGAAEHALPLKSLDDVSRLHARISERLAAAQSADPETRSKLLACSVIGAGASGVEAACALQRFLISRLAREAPELLPHLSCRLVQADPQILPGFPLSIIRGVERILARKNIALHLNAKITRVNADELETADGKRLPSALSLWTAGIQPNLIPTQPSLQTEPAHAWPVDRYLRAAPDIFAAGDSVRYQEGNMVIPKNAQTAMLMGAHIGRNLVHHVRNQSLAPFRYRSRGSLLALGDTGFIHVKFFALRSPLTPFIRDLFYRRRLKQLTR